MRPFIGRYLPVVNHEPTDRPGGTVVQVRGTSDERSDAELVAAVVEHDRGALRELFERHEPAGVAIGSSVRSVWPSMIVGMAFWFLAFGLYWAWNNAGVHAFAPLVRASE